MIEEFVKRFELRREWLRQQFAAAHPDSYIDIVRTVVKALHDEDSYGTPDPARVHQIDDGDYQGTLVFIIAAEGYQPSTYWAVKVNYGSCSGCDTLQSIHDYGDDPPTEKQISEYMTLATHILQGLKEI